MGTMVEKGPFSFFRDKRVIVTGDTGFKGSWLALWLTMLGAEVVGYALPPERERDHYNAAGVGRVIRHVDGDIRDYDLLHKVAAEFDPHVVFHLAAQALVRRSYAEPRYTFDTNVGGSINVLEAARSLPSLKCLIYVTSDKCYLNKEWVWGYRETDELGGRDPYSASKAAAEMAFAGYMNAYFLEREGFGTASARAGNVIGGGDWAEDRIVPDCIRALQEGRPVVLRNPAATRPWQHVLEPLAGYLTLAERLGLSPAAYNGSWNFGPASEGIHTVADLASRIIDVWGAGTIETPKLAGEPREARLLHLNCDKAHSELGWRCRWDFARTVKATAEWYREVFEGRPAAEKTAEQIRAYMEDMV